MMKNIIALLIGFIPTIAVSGTIITAAEPDTFPVGTNIQAAFPNITLTVESDPSREVVCIDGYDLFNGRNLATTGDLVFGYFPTLPHATGQGKVWDEDTFGLLRADFERLVGFVEIDAIYDDDDDAILSAYDRCGNLLQTTTASGDGRSPNPYSTLELTVVSQISLILQLVAPTLKLYS